MKFENNAQSGLSMKIREIARKELDQLLDLYGHLHKFDTPLPQRQAVEAIWNELTKNPRYKCFGAYLNEILVSSCTISIIPNLTRGCRPYGVIENVVTNSAYRNKGKSGFGACIDACMVSGLLQSHASSRQEI